MAQNDLHLPDGNETREELGIAVVHCLTAGLSPTQIKAEVDRVADQQLEDAQSSLRTI